MANAASEPSVSFTRFSTSTTKRLAIPRGPSAAYGSTVYEGVGFCSAIQTKLAQEGLRLRGANGTKKEQNVRNSPTGSADMVRVET
jgi:hypothetical protein